MYESNIWILYLDFFAIMLDFNDWQCSATLTRYDVMLTMATMVSEAF